jgi:4-hydroxy-tetrahydrodipicolinate synthase
MEGSLMSLLPNGVVAPILTPFNQDLSVSTERYVAHAQSLLEEGCVGLAPFGTTGEALSIGLQERQESLESLVAGGIDPQLLVVGAGLPDLPGTIHLTRHAIDLGCAAVMVLPPFYYKNPPAEGLFIYYADLIERVGSHRLKIVLYHIPQVAGVGLSVDLVGRLQGEFPDVVVGIKDSSGNWENTKRLFEFEELTVYPGNELSLVDALDLGGHGCITATANVRAGPIAEVVSLYGAGRRDEAIESMASVRAFRLALQEYAPIPAMKRLLAFSHQDPTWANVRPPFIPLSASEGEELRTQLAVY